MEYHVSIKKCEQVSPDDWELFIQSLKITDKTTIGEISSWIRRKFNDKENKMKMNFTVTQLQDLTEL